MFKDLLSKVKKTDASNKSEETAEVSEIKDTEIVEGAATSAEDNSADESAQKRSKIIRLVVVGGLVYYGLTEFVFKDPPPAEPVAKIKAKPKKDGNKVDAVGKTDPKSDAKMEPKADVKAEDDLKDTNQNKPEVAVEETKPIAKPIVKEEPKQPPVEEITISKKPEEPTLPQPILNDPQMAEKEIDKKIDQLIEKEEQKSKQIEEPKAQVKNEGKTVRKEERREEPKKITETDMKDKIVVEENYLEPPLYSALGRGLVYNCTDKYWACLSKTAYIQCNKNMKWNRANAKPVECAVVNVYLSDEDCETVQKYNISTAQPTSFCK